MAGGSKRPYTIRGWERFATSRAQGSEAEQTNRGHLEHLLQYCARPPFALEWLRSSRRPSRRPARRPTGESSCRAPKRTLVTRSAGGLPLLVAAKLQGLPLGRFPAAPAGRASREKQLTDLPAL